MTEPKHPCDACLIEVKRLCEADGFIDECPDVRRYCREKAQEEKQSLTSSPKKAK